MRQIFLTGASGMLGRQFLRLSKEEFMITLGGKSKKLNTYNWQYFNLEKTEATLDLRGFDCVIHLASNTKEYRSKADIIGTKALLKAIKAARVPHIIYISIVGVDALPLPYFKTKYRVERLIQDSDLDYSILRSTQFFEFFESEIHKYSRRKVGIFPNLKYQPIEVEKVAIKLKELCFAKPLNEIIEIGGSEIITMKQAMVEYAKYTNKKTIRLGIPSFLLGKYGGALTTPQKLSKGLTWSQYLQHKYLS